MRVIASILTHDNAPGLNALLWSIALQDHKPDRIIITNTGGPISGAQMWGTINHISSIIPIEVRSKPNIKHFGKLKQYFTQDMDADTLVWFLEDDLIIPHHALAMQLGRSRWPNVPMVEEFGLKTHPEESFNAQLRETEAERLDMGAYWAMLCSARQFRGINLTNWFLGADSKITASLRPYIVKNVTVYHTRPTSEKPDLYLLLERLIRGEM